MDEIHDNIYLNRKYFCYIEYTYTIIIHIINNGYIPDMYIEEIYKYSQSKYLSSRRIAKKILNSAKYAANEIIELFESKKTLSSLSFHSIIQLLYIILLCNNNPYYVSIDEKYYILKEKIGNKYTINELYYHLCNFNIIYTCHFIYKLSFILSLINRTNYTKKHKFYYELMSDTYIKNVYVSMKNSSITFWRKYHFTTFEQFIDIYTDLLVKHNINNPVLYIFNFCDLSIINACTNIIRIKNSIRRTLYYNILLLFSNIYLYEIRDDDKLNILLQNEYANLIVERIKLYESYELYFLKASNINNFILYITSNNIVLSKHLVHRIFWYDIYFSDNYNIVDSKYKIYLCVLNNIQIKTFNFHWNQNEYLSNNYINLLDITWMDEHCFFRFLQIIKLSKMKLTDNNIIKLQQYDHSLYSIVFNR